MAARKSTRRKATKRKPAKRKATKRKATKRKATKRKATKRKATKRKATKRKATKRKATKRKATKRKATKRKATKRKATKRKATKRKATKRKATKRKATKRKATKRKATKRKATKRKATKRKATKRKATKRKATKRKATKRKATKRKATKRKANQAQGDQAQGHQAQGNQAQGDEAQGDEAQGDEAQGHQAQGDQAQGDQAQGHQAQGNQAQGHQAQAGSPQGDQAQEHASQPALAARLRGTSDRWSVTSGRLLGASRSSIPLLDSGAPSGTEVRPARPLVYVGGAMTTSALPRIETVRELYDAPLLRLVARAAVVHAEYHDPERVQCSTLLSVKTGGCPEDCGYCPQSARYRTGVDAEALLDVESVLEAARAAKANGSSRFCMGAAWREVSDGPEFDRVVEMVKGVAELGLESCVTLGMLRPDQAQRLADAGLDYYNHNLDTSRAHYERVISTRGYDDRLATLDAVANAGLRTCCGGIVGMGESDEDRIEFLHTLASRDPPPESVPINALVPAPGTPLESSTPLAWDVLVRMVACARILHAAVGDPARGRPALARRCDAGDVLPGGGRVDLPRRAAAHDAEPRARRGHRAARASRPPANALMTDPRAAFEERLRELDQAGLGRRLTLPRGRDFSSNDYLGLSRHPGVVAAARAAVEQHGAGNPSARLLRGTQDVHVQAERAAAEWTGSDAALLFPSGWHANVALLTTLPTGGDVIVSPRGNHASIVDGCRLSRARTIVARCDDAASVAEALRSGRGAGTRYVVVESVHSTTGRRADLAGLARVCRDLGAWLIVDEAHAAGVLGARGAGCGGAEEVRDRVVARVVTGGKALGVSGAFAVGDAVTVRLLTGTARPFVFTTAVPPAVAAGLRAAIDVAARSGGLRARLTTLADRLRSRLTAAGIDAGGDAAIVPVPIGDPRRAVEAAARLQERGFDVRALRPPTVPPGASCLRVVVHATHTEDEVDALADALHDVLEPIARRTSPPAVVAAPVVVLGTDTGVGKTLVAALACRALARAGHSVHYVKPVQTGDDDDARTVASLCAPHDVAASALRGYPLPASVDQAVAHAGSALDVETVLRDVSFAARECARSGTRSVVEGAGGLLVPVDDRGDLGDVFARLGAPVLLVARSGLGTLNHTLLTVEALTRRGLRLRALVLSGPPHAANVASLRARLGGVPILELPRLEAPDGSALDAWLDSRPDFTEALS